MQYKWTVLTVTTVGVLMSGIDARILVVGLPQVAFALHADAEQAVWFTQGYALSSTITLLLVGRISDIYGRTRLYEIGFAIFTLGSLLTALSMSANEMIIFRLFQGIGSAIMWAISLALITDATPKNELGLSLGVNQIASRLGSVLGLSVSGLILLFFSWPALFYINIPIGIFGTVWAHLRLKEKGTLDKGVPMDWIGIGTFTIFLTSILLALTLAAYGLAEMTIVELLLIASVASFAAFLAHERKCEHPVLDLALFRATEFGASVLAALFYILATSALLLLVSLYLQLVLGLSPFVAGISILPMDAAMIVTAPLSGRLSDRFGRMPFMLGGLSLGSVSIFMFSLVNQSTPSYLIGLYLALLGIGSSVFLTSNGSWCMGSVQANRRGVAASVRNMAFYGGLTVSFNLAIFIMTFTLPYGVITTVISSGTASQIPESFKNLFESGLKTSFIWLAALNAAAIIPTFLGARTSRQKLKSFWSVAKSLTERQRN